jgi:hypothetical protein
MALFVAPETALANPASRVSLLLVPYVVAHMDAFWAMNTLVKFRRYNELLVRRKDLVIVYLVSGPASAGRRAVSLSGVLDKAYDLYRADEKRIFLDVSVFADRRVPIASTPGLDWTDDLGVSLDADRAVERIGFIPALNVSGMWATRPTYAAGLLADWQSRYGDLRFDPARIVHGLLGEHWMQGLRRLQSARRDADPETREFFKQMGLRADDNRFQGERWLMFSPQTLMLKKKLPLVFVVTEVYPYDEYAASQAYAEFLDYFRLAAQGELNLMFFAGESVDTTDRAYELIKDAARTYPIDLSRVYVTGHSHNGHFAREFAYRHPDLVAALATLGNSAGFAAPAYSHEAVIVDDARIAAWRKIDMPTVTIGAASEVTDPHSMRSSWINDYDQFVDAWERRLAASRAPAKTRQQMEAAEHSDDYVTRIFGLPNDGSELQMIDGVEHYLIDVANLEGHKHLRLVGVDNMLHTTEPTMPVVAWTFMRRFARDADGRTVELP